MAIYFFMNSRGKKINVQQFPAKKEGKNYTYYYTAIHFEVVYFLGEKIAHGYIFFVDWKKGGNGY